MSMYLKHIDCPSLTFEVFYRNSYRSIFTRVKYRYFKLTLLKSSVLILEFPRIRISSSAIEEVSVTDLYIESIS